MLLPPTMRPLGHQSLRDFRTIRFREIEITEWAVEIHARSQHMRINNKNLLAFWTRNFYGLPHRNFLLIQFLVILLVELRDQKPKP